MCVGFSLRPQKKSSQLHSIILKGCYAYLYGTYKGLAFYGSGGTVDGMYFNYNVADVSAALGEPLVHWGVYKIKRERDGKVADALMWTTPDGGSPGPDGREATGHGRWNEGQFAGDWVPGDKFTFESGEEFENPVDE